jgi:hypothetical protein
MAVDIDGPAGRGTAIVPVLALATTERGMPPWLGGVLVVLGAILTAGLLTLIGAGVRESVLPPGEEAWSTLLSSSASLTNGAALADRDFMDFNDARDDEAPARKHASRRAA